MVPIAVGGFNQHQVCFDRCGGVGQHRSVVAAQIAPEQQGSAASQLRHYVRRPEQVASRYEADADARGNFDVPVVTEWLQLGERAEGVRLAIQRQGRMMFGVAMPVCLSRILFLDAAPSRAARGGTGRRVPPVQKMRPAISLCDEARQITDVIEVRVSQHDRGDRLWRNGKRLPVAKTQFLESLKQSAVNEHSASAVLQQVLGAGYRPRGAEKGQSGHMRTISSLPFGR